MMESPMLARLPIVIVPGIGNSGPSHWQTMWHQRHPHWHRVIQRDWKHPRCREWVSALDQTVAACPSPPILVAHSLGCLVVGHWAKRSNGTARAALLVAVPDPQAPAFPAAAEGFDVLPLWPLGMPSLVVASTDDPIGSVAHARRCAAAWHSDVVVVASAGHLNADSGYGPWPEGFSLLERLADRTTG